MRANWTATAGNWTSARPHAITASITRSISPRRRPAIKSVYNLSSYPDIPASDDLTQSANGIAYLLLYQFRVVNNAITDVVKKVKAVQYSQTQFSQTNNLLADLDTNLNDLKQGLRNGEVTPLQCTKISPPDWTELITGTAKASVTLPDDGLFEILIQNSFNTSHPDDQGIDVEFYYSKRLE